MRDQFVFRIAVSDTEANDTEKFLETLYRERVILKEAIKDGILEVPSVEWCRPSDLEYNPRTGKLKVVIDRRQ